MAITSSELSNKTAPSGNSYEYGYVCYDTDVIFEGNYQIKYKDVPDTSPYSTTYSYFRPQVYYSLNGNTLYGTLYFLMCCTSGAFAASGVQYDLKINCYNASKQFMSTITVINKHDLYKCKYASYSTQWSGGKMYNWNLKKFSSGGQTYPQLMLGLTGDWPSTYTDLRLNLQIVGAEAGSGGGYISLEPFYKRYASDTYSTHYNEFTRYTNVSKKLTYDNCLNHRSAPSNGGCIDFSVNLPSGTTYITYTMTTYTNGGSGRSVTFPDFGQGPMPVLTYSHFYRHNGSSWQRVATADYMFPGWDHVKVYKYNGSQWEPGAN